MKRKDVFYREVSIDKAGINAEARTVELSFSSEQPVQRTDYETGKTYNEVLSHKSGDVDLSRLQNAAPLK